MKFLHTSDWHMGKVLKGHNRLDEQRAVLSEIAQKELPRGRYYWRWTASPRYGSRPRWLGHSSPTVTLGYYAHFMPEAGSKGRAVLDGLLGKRGRSACQPKLPRFSPGLIVPGSQALGACSWAWIIRLADRMAWESADRSHRDPLHHTPA